MKDALSNIIHSSTLKTRLASSSTLELHSISPFDFYDLNRAASNEMASMASHAAIDYISSSMSGMRFPYFHSLIFYLYSGRRRVSTELKFLPFIYINISSTSMHSFNMLSLLIGSLCISLTSPATLERLKFNILLGGSTYDITQYILWEFT